MWGHGSKDSYEWPHVMYNEEGVELYKDRNKSFSNLDMDFV